MRLVLDMKLTPVQIAEAFAEMNDEDQAQFFIEAARIFESWGADRRIMQAHNIGGHLRTCSCSTHEARAVVRDIADAIEGAS